MEILKRIRESADRASPMSSVFSNPQRLDGNFERIEVCSTLEINQIGGSLLNSSPQDAQDSLEDSIDDNLRRIGDDV